jgi:hypothetical protein
MIDLIIAASALTGAPTAIGEVSGYRVYQSEPAAPEHKRSRSWLLPETNQNRGQGCFSLVEKALPGFGTLRIGPRCSSSERPVPWR